MDRNHQMTLRIFAKALLVTIGKMDNLYCNCYKIFELTIHDYIGIEMRSLS